MSVLEPDAAEIARAREREQWFADNAETLYLGALMFCGKPPCKLTPTSRAAPGYQHWLRVAWQKMWDMVPDKYKVDHEYYYCGFDRRQQAEELKTGFETWAQGEDNGT